MQSFSAHLEGVKGVKGASEDGQRTREREIKRVKVGDQSGGR